MKYLGHLITLSLYCLPALASYPDEINYPHYQHIYQNESQALMHLTRSYQNLDRETRNLFSEIQGMELTFNNYSNEIVNINSNIRRLSDESRSLSYQRDNLLRNERDLSHQLNRAKSEYESLRREVDNETRRLGPIRDRMARAEFEARTARNNQNAEMNRLRSVESELRSAQNSLSRVRSDISRLESTPNRTPSQQSSLNNLYAQRSRLESEISRKSMQVSQLQGSVNQLARQVASKESELRNIRSQLERETSRLNQLQARLSNAQRVYNDYEFRLRSTRTSLTNTERRITSIRTEVTRFESRKRDIERSQVSLRYQIESSQRRYSQQLSQLSGLNLEVQRQQVVTNDAQVEYQRRASLYHEHLESAQALGRSQVVSATERGSEQGEKDAQKKGAVMGANVGTSHGKASGNLWGSVRAEVLGYQEGYDIGYHSPRHEAEHAADLDAAKAARAFVESILRPTYFEEVVLAEIKKPFIMQKSLELPLRAFTRFVKSTDSAWEVSEDELRASDELVTNLDIKIDQFKNEKKLSDQHLEQAQNAINSYTQQEEYPYDRVECLAVYKGVVDFKEACESSFTEHYAEAFEDAAYKSFVEKFKPNFDKAFDHAFLKSLEEQYLASYASAYEVSKAFGKEEGLRVMYDEAYELQYQISYEKHLVSEKLRVRSEVQEEFRDFLDRHPLLTMVSVNAPTEIIAGDTFSVSSLMRNLGREKSGIAHLNISRITGAEILTQKTVTNEIAARSQKEESGPVVRVLPQMVTGSKIVIEVEATLPGDNYKSSRIEKMVLERTVNINPEQDLKLNVDYTPSIRSVLRRFLIHTLSVEVTPKFEDLKSELQVRLVPLQGEEQMELKTSQQVVGKMSQGSKQNIKFSYVFKDSANGKVIKLALEFLYKGRVVQTQEVELKPH